MTFCANYKSTNVLIPVVYHVQTQILTQNNEYEPHNIS